MKSSGEVLQMEAIAGRTLHGDKQGAGGQTRGQPWE